MNDTHEKPWILNWLPARRFEPDFPLALWFAGLWFYLKSFLYICYLYMIGLDPQPFVAPVKVEIVYFGLAWLPSLLLAPALWNEKKGAVKPAIFFLLVDTPFLLFHVMRLAEAGFLESGLTSLLEYGSLGLNLFAVGWLIVYMVQGKVGRT